MAEPTRIKLEQELNHSIRRFRSIGLDVNEARNGFMRQCSEMVFCNEPKFGTTEMSGHQKLYEANNALLAAMAGMSEAIDLVEDFMVMTGD